MSWDMVEAVVKAAAPPAIAWDGCHKIYVLMDDAQVTEMEGYGYNEGGSVMIYARHASPSEMLTYLHTWYDDSCGLRFINSVRTVEGNPNDGFETLIGQFEDEEDEEPCLNCDDPYCNGHECLEDEDEDD